MHSQTPTKRVAVLRGGPSDEYDISMLTGAAVLEGLTQAGYTVKDVTITKQGDWLEGGRAQSLPQILEGVDVVFVALHGAFGEDGGLQRLLDPFGVPYTGSGALSSTVAFNKKLTKQALAPHGVRVALDYRLSQAEVSDMAQELSAIRAHLGDEVFVKPLASGSSVGAQTVHLGSDVQDVVAQLLQEHEYLLFEEHIDGVEATVGILEGFRDEALYALPVVEIVPPEHAEFYDREVKYNGDTKHIVPGNFSNVVRDELQRIAKLVHKELGLSQYSRSDFLVRDNEIYFLEVNTLPGFTSESNFPIAAAAIGLSFPELVTWLVERAA